MTREAERECHDRERRVRRPGGGEHGAPRHVQVGDAMDSTIGIDDTSAGIGMHAGRAHVVTRSAHRGRPRIGFSSHRARHGARGVRLGRLEIKTYDAMHRHSAAAMHRDPLCALRRYMH